MWEFTTATKWTGGSAADVGSSGKPTLNITPPPEFGGQEGHWTPEDLLMGAVESCQLLTFLFFVNKMGIGLESYESETTGKMDRTPEGLRIQGVDISIKAVVRAEEDVAKVEQAVDQAESFCPISAALSCPITVSAEASVGSEG